MEPVLLTISPSWISLKREEVKTRQIVGCALFSRESEDKDSHSKRVAEKKSRDLPIVTQDDNTNIISFQVEGHTLDTAAELNHLTSLDLGETENSGNTISNWDHSTEFLKIILHKVG